MNSNNRINNNKNEKIKMQSFSGDYSGKMGSEYREEAVEKLKDIFIIESFILVPYWIPFRKFTRK